MNIRTNTEMSMISDIMIANNHYSIHGLRDLYSANKMYHTRYNRELAISISKYLEAKTSLGRNQAIELLLSTTKGLLNAQ